MWLHSKRLSWLKYVSTSTVLLLVDVPAILAETPVFQTCIPHSADGNVIFDLIHNDYARVVGFVRMLNEQGASLTPPSEKLFYAGEIPEQFWLDWLSAQGKIDSVLSFLLRYIINFDRSLKHVQTLEHILALSARNSSQTEFEQWVKDTLVKLFVLEPELISRDWKEYPLLDALRSSVLNELIASEAIKITTEDELLRAIAYVSLSSKLNSAALGKVLSRLGSPHIENSVLAELFDQYIKIMSEFMVLNDLSNMKSLWSEFQSLVTKTGQACASVDFYPLQASIVDLISTRLKDTSTFDGQFYASLLRQRISFVTSSQLSTAPAQYCSRLGSVQQKAIEFSVILLRDPVVDRSAVHANSQIIALTNYYYAVSCQ